MRPAFKPSKTRWAAPRSNFCFSSFRPARLSASPRSVDHGHLPSRFAHAAKQPTPIGNGRGAPTVPHARARCVASPLLYSPRTTVRARRGGMACAAAPSPLPARRSATAPRVVFAVGPHPPRFYGRFRPSTVGAPRSSLRVVASSSKADPVEEKSPVVAPLADVPVSADASSSPGPPVEPQPQVSTG